MLKLLIITVNKNKISVCISVTPAPCFFVLHNRLVKIPGLYRGVKAAPHLQDTCGKVNHLICNCPPEGFHRSLLIIIHIFFTH